MRRPESTVTRKGQITVPVAIRKALGIESGDRVSFVLEDGTAASIAISTGSRPSSGSSRDALEGC